MSPPSPANASRFLQLPREIRNMVFNELWKLEPIRNLRYQGNAVDLHYGNVDASSTRLHYGLPVWLLACKTFLIEGQDQARLHSSWVFRKPRGDLEEHDSEVVSWRRPPQRWDDWEDTSVRQDSKLLDMSTVRQLTFRTGIPAMLFKKICKITSEDQWRIYGALESLPQPSPNLRVFRLSSDLKYHHFITQPEDWTLDLRWLEEFDLGITEFEYEVKRIERLQVANVGYQIVVAWKLMQPAFAREVARVGEILVGGPGTIEVKVVSKRYLKGGSWTSTSSWKFKFNRS